MINIKIERLIDCLEELAPILAGHWDEVEHDKDEVPLKPDFVTYLKLEEAGHIMLVVARADDKIIGYQWDVVHTNLHYSELYAVNDLMYLNKEYRGSGVFNAMSDVAEEYLISLGVKVRTITFKVESDKMSHGYKLVEHVHHKNLGV